MPNSKQDNDKKMVKQTIFGEEADFNYADFEDLKNNRYYDRFLAGQLNLSRKIRVLLMKPRN